MARRRWEWLFLAAVMLPLLVYGLDRVWLIRWVGSTDLEVEFAVTDAATDGPVPGARVEVQSEVGCDTKDFEQDLTIPVDAAGSARMEVRPCVCFGTQSGLRFTDTFVVHLPYWRCRVIAESYEPSEWANLDVLKQRRQVRRIGPGKAKLVVPMSLHKKPAAPGTSLPTDA